MSSEDENERRLENVLIKKMFSGNDQLQKDEETSDGTRHTASNSKSSTLNFASNKVFIWAIRGWSYRVSHKCEQHEETHQIWLEVLCH